MTQRKAPRIRQLEALMAVITNGSVTAAAADLGISQPAASRLIADLAKEFDFPLFEKFTGFILKVCSFPQKHFFIAEHEEE